MRKASCAPIRLTWSLPPHLPLPEFLRGLTSKLRRAHNTLIAYVDRFARNWPRLATTDLSCIYNYTLSKNFCKCLC